MKQIVRTTGLAALIGVVAIGAAACGDDNESTGTAGGDTTTVVSTATTNATTATTQGRTGAPADGGTETTVQGEATAEVTLGKPQEMAISMPAIIRAGEVKFEVTNSGSVPHEFVLLKTQTKAADLPVEGGKAKETGLVDKTADLEAGGTATVEVNLQPGHYVVLCNVPGHYQAGMYKDLTVQQ